MTEDFNLPLWAAPLAKVLAAFIRSGGGKYIVHYPPEGGEPRLEITIAVNRKSAHDIAQRLGLK